MKNSLCVCIVDDQSDEVFPIQVALERLGIESHWFPTAEALLESDALVRAACVVLDIELPGMSGLMLQSELHARSKALPTIMMSGRATVSDAIRAFELGACGFFEKPFELEKLLHSIDRLITAEGDRRHREHERLLRFEMLSQREKEVLEQLVAGKNVKVIGRELGISPSTAEKHRASVLLKTGFESVIELTRYLLTDKDPESSMANFATRRVDRPSAKPQPKPLLRANRRVVLAQ